MFQLTARTFNCHIRRLSSNPQLIVHSVNTDILTDNSKPVSLLLGFAGAKTKHIEKYADVYKKQGLPCLSYTGINWADNVPEPDEGAAFAPLFENPFYRDRKLIIHTVSMNGFRSLAKLYRWMDQRTMNGHKIAGIVFDSCPSVTNVTSTMHGMAVSRPSQPCGDYAYLPAALRKSIKHQAYSKLNPSILPSQVLFHYIGQACHLPQHQHYIYTKADDLIDYKHIEAFIARQVAKGCNVTSKRYEDVAHVRHLNEDPEGYYEQVEGLVKRSLNRKKN